MTTLPLLDGWSVRRPAGPFAGASGDAPDLRPARLPHDALRDEQRTPEAPGKGAGAYYPNAAYTYLRDVLVPDEWRGKVVRLEIQGAFRRAQIFLNTEFVGNRADGYARFFVDLTPFLVFGKTNQVRIEVRSGEDSRWYSGAGLHRPVVLHVDEPTHIVPDGLVVRTERLDSGLTVLGVRTTIANRELATRTVRIRCELTSAAGDVLVAESTPFTLAPGEVDTAVQHLYLQDPELWSPDSPTLHHARIFFDDESTPRATTRFGIRVVTADAFSGMLINGSPVLLRGACVHHDNGPLGAAAIERAERRRVELLKDAGFNAIRATHNPLSIAMLDACDELGVLVIDEAFDMWTRFKTPYDYAAEFPQWWESDLDAMVLKDLNHPSVIMYSIGNEIAEVGTPHGARWARRLANRVRALDPTRLVTNGVNVFLAVLDDLPETLDNLGLNTAMGLDGMLETINTDARTGERIEESSSVLDVLGLNYAEQRYELDACTNPSRALVGSETFPPQIGRLWAMVKAHPHVIGDFTWTGWDYLGEVGIGSVTYESETDAAGKLEREYPYLTALTGDIDITGSRRPISYYREIVFGLRTAPYIAVQRPDHHGETVVSPSPWSWSDSIRSWTWTGYEGAPICVEVYADADTVELFLDGVPLGEAVVGESLPMLARFEVTFTPGSLEAVAYKDGAEVGRDLVRTGGAPRLTANPDRAQIYAGDTDLSFIAIEVRDEMGTLISDRDCDVTVSVTGAGSLAGMCSANPKTTEQFSSHTWKTFDGRALAIVRPDRTGAISVTISSPYGDASVEILVLAAAGDNEGTATA